MRGVSNMINRDELLSHCIKRISEVTTQLDAAWETENNFALNEEKAGEVLDQLNVLYCELTKHNFILDQCGYWQHQYCTHCNQGKYPKLVVKNCGQLREEMGHMTEEQYSETSSILKQFEMTPLFFSKSSPEIFTEDDPPSWLASKDTKWFYDKHILTLEVDQHIDTDFQRITRIT